MRITIIINICVLLPSYALGDSMTCPKKWPNCGKTKNIVCERDENCLAKEGCENVESDAEFLKWILHEHNRLRNEIATGKESRGFTGAASNMMALSYDKDLEFTAACHANRCKFKHDICRGTAKFPAAGQNLFHARGNSSALREAVTNWFEEIKLSTLDVIDKFPKGRTDKIGHYSQLIWAKTTHIGCAIAKSKHPQGDQFHLTCNYGPQGNIIGQKVYIKGPPCSKCPKNIKCNARYPGLCGVVDETKIEYGKQKVATLTASTGIANVTNKQVTKMAPTTPASGNIYFSSKYFIFCGVFIILFY